MEAAAVTPHCELFRDEIIARNKSEIALRLKEAGFDEDFTNSLIQTSRAASSIKSSTAPSVKTYQRRRRSASHELDFVPRRSTRQRQTRENYEPPEATQPTGHGKVTVSVHVIFSCLLFEKRPGVLRLSVGLNLNP